MSGQRAFTDPNTARLSNSTLHNGATGRVHVAYGLQRLEGAKRFAVKNECDLQNVAPENLRPKTALIDFQY